MADALPRELNVAVEGDKNRRRKALENILAITRNTDIRLDAEQLTAITKVSVKAFEDKAERCREAAVSIIKEITPLQGPEVLDWVMPSIVARIGLEGVAEKDKESEELRLQLLQLAMLCLETFPHEIGPRNYLDYFKILLENCLKDEYGDLKRLACTACMQLCVIEPKRMKPLALPLAKVMKMHCLQHKLRSVRVDAVKAFADLIAHGAADILADMKDELDNRTTASFIFILCHDHSEDVRLATLELLSRCLLDITERSDQPRRLLNHVLGMLTDPQESVRLRANSLMLAFGKQYLVDNEDNRIDFEKRRVTMKDIEWYADADYPEMKLITQTSLPLIYLDNRPHLGARYSVAEHVRGFLDSVLKDVQAVNWMIPFSNVNKRFVALRSLAMIIIFCEQNIVQFAQEILGVMYKIVRDEDKGIATEALLCVELLGKFLKPDIYIPFILSKPAPKPDGEAIEAEPIERVKKGNKVITIVAEGDDNAPAPKEQVPTLFSTAAATTKTGILMAFRLLLLGSTTSLQREQATQLVKAVCSNDVMDLDAPLMLHALLDVHAAVIDLLVINKFVATPATPMPDEIAKNVKQHTLDAMIMYGALSLRACEDASVGAHVDRTVAHISTAVTGDPKALYSLHFGRLMEKHLATMSPEALTALIENTPELTPHAQFLTELFVARLTEVNYQLQVKDELNFFGILKNVLRSDSVRFDSDQMELLLRRVIFEHCKFAIGHASPLFRKLAVSCLKLVVTNHLKILAAAFAAEDGGLADKTAQMWLNNIDCDDSEVRMSCVECAGQLALLPMAAGSGSELVDHLLGRMDDSSDIIRLHVAEAFKSFLYNADTCKAVGAAVTSKLALIAKKLLIHLDDHQEKVGLKEVLVVVMKRLVGINEEVVKGLTKQAREKHFTPRFCDEILSFVPNQ